MLETEIEIKCPECGHIGQIPISYLKYNNIKCSNCKKNFQLQLLINRYIVSLAYEILDQIIEIEKIIINNNFIDINIKDNILEKILVIKSSINNIEIIQNNVSQYIINDNKKIEQLLEKIDELINYNNELELINNNLIEECNKLEEKFNIKLDDFTNSNNEF